MTDAVLLALCTCPDDISAEQIAATLVEERLAACVNRVSGLLSIYRWQDEVERAPETLLLIKTTEARFDALVERVRALHPHELPEIIAVAIAKGLPDYLHWVSTCTADQA
jgi:periplasmic divalent cation tolerance protein